MEIGIIEQVLQNIGQSAVALIGMLQPSGIAIAGAMILISLVVMSMAMWRGIEELPQLAFNWAVFSGFTLVLIQAWPAAVLWTVDASRNIIGLAIPGYTGPTSMFEAAYQMAQRVWAEPEGWALNPLSWGSAWARHLVYGVGGYLIFLGMSVPGLLAILAEVQLMVLSVLAPIVLPFFAFDLTRSIGNAALMSLLNGGLKIAFLGLVAALFSRAVTAVIDLPAANEVLTMEAVAALVLTALIAAIIGWSANGLANSLTGGGVGTLGLGAMAAPAAAVINVVSSAAGGAAAAEGASAGGSGSLAAAGGRVASRSSGSAFGAP